ncbi:MAG: T9SS type A sorting domain-containing protein [Adhaeribacter sp.]
MQKNFTHLITAVSRARNHRAVIATLLLFMLLLLAKSVSAQTNVYTNTFTTTADANRITSSFRIVTSAGQQNTAFISTGTDGQIQVTGNNGSPKGYNGYIVTKPAISATPGYNYIVKIKAKVAIGVGNLEIRYGSTPEIVMSSSGTSILNSSLSNTAYNEYTSNSFNVSSSQDLFIGFYVTSEIAKAEIYLDEITVTASCIGVVADNAGTDVTVCSGNTALIGTVAQAGFTYSWSPSTGLSNANIARPEVSLINEGSSNITQTYTLTSTSACGVITTNDITVTVQPPSFTNPTFSGVTAGATYFTGEAYPTGSSNYSLTLRGTLPTGTTTGTFSGPGISGNQIVGRETVAIFNPCSALAPGENEKIINIIYKVSNGSCQASVSKQILVKRSTYTVVNSANIFPICKGSNTLYTASVYRDIELIDVRDSRHSQHLEWKNLPASDFKKDSYYRYWQPEPLRKDGKTTIDGKPLPPVDLKLDETLFNYQWWKNGNSIQGNKVSTKQAGLSATDQYFVVVTPKIAGSLTCNGTLQTPVRQDLVATDINPVVPVPVAGESNHLWYSSPANYSLTLTSTNPVCANQDVVISATKNFGNVEFTNLQVFFYKINAVTKDTIQLNDVAIATHPATIILKSSTVTDGSNSNLKGEFSNGDIIYVAWYTNEIKCLSADIAASLTLKVALPQIITGGGAYCFGGTGVPVGLQSSQTGISYQLLLNGNKIGNPVAGTGNAITFGNQTEAGSYSVQPIASGINCSTFGATSVTVYNLPEKPTATNQTVCSDGTSTQKLTASATAPDGFKVIWYTSLTGPITTTSPTLTGVGTVTYWAAAQNNTTECISATRTPVTLTINVLPAAPQASNQTVCSNGNPTQTLTASAPISTGFNLIWYTSSDLTNFTTTTTPIQQGIGTVTYYASYRNQTTSCVGPRTPVTLTIKALPGAPAVQDLSYCQNEFAPALTATATPGATLLWYTSIDDITPSSSIIPSTTLIGTTSYWVSQIIDGCEGPRAELKVTVPPLTTWRVELTSNPEAGEIEYGKPVTYTAKTYTTDPNTGAPVSVNMKATYRWEVYYSNVDVPNNEEEFTVKQNGLSNTFTITVPTPDPKLNFEMVVRVFVTPGPSDFCMNKNTQTASTARMAPLPVELIYLKADKKDNNVVALEWATAMEKNSEGFEVQVSQDAKNYRTLAFVASKAGGNTNQKQVYTFHDKENGKYGTRYYRLMQRDINGDSEYFGPKAVKIGDAVESLSAYPNPFSSEVSLEFNAEEAGTMQVLVTDAAGAKILERTLPAAKGNNRTLLQLNSRLPQGMYIITTRLNGKTNHIKLLKN